ncbi:MAG: Hpt domain-containing protein [Proteobacteria bacterium]|nr:MAG: Hpt domain-containing protein [Pseudomonadota bacterium]
MSDTNNDVIFSLYKDQPIYRDLLQDFVSCLEERLALSRKAFENKSWKDLSGLMHQLRGAAATYGFPALAAIAGTIELDAANPSVEPVKIASSIDAISLTCRKIEAGMALLPAL